jgi:hypothetical protein
VAAVTLTSGELQATFVPEMNLLGASVVPMPGVDVAVDITVLLKMIEQGLVTVVMALFLMTFIAQAGTAPARAAAAAAVPQRPPGGELHR